MKTKKKIIVRDSMECQSCVSGREDVNEKLDREIARDYAAICFSALFVFIIVWSTIAVIKWTLWQFGVSLVWWQFGLIVGVVWCIIICVVMWIGMRKAKMNDGK